MKEFFLEAEDEKEEEKEADKDDKKEQKKISHLLRKNTGLILGITGSTLFLLSILFTFDLWQSKPNLPVAKTSEVLVTIEPPDARVLLDDKQVGLGSPITITDITPEEEHKITVEREGYIPQTRQLKLKTGEFRNFEINLSPTQKPKCTVTISSTPSKAKVFLNDTETPYLTPATIKELETNKTYTLGLYLEGYKYLSKTFDTKSNETYNFDVQLIPDYSSLSIDSDPPGALVVIDKKPSGQTPLSIENLEPRKVYRVEVWSTGYEPFSEEIMIEPGKKKEMHVILKKEPLVPPPDSAKPEPLPEPLPAAGP